jgi:hypothetical protein
MAVHDLGLFYKCFQVFSGPHEQAIEKQRRQWWCPLSLIFAFRKVINGSFFYHGPRAVRKRIGFGVDRILFFLAESFNNLSTVT